MTEDLHATYKSYAHFDHSHVDYVGTHRQRQAIHAHSLVI